MASKSSGNSMRYYVRGSIVPFEEDMYHEFKGHRSISVEELPPWTHEKNDEKASRRAVSRALNAFLNTGKGGTCYLGMLDNGQAKGIELTQFQKDHVMASIDEVFSRYSPPVKRHRYKVRFKPVLESDSVDEFERFQSEDAAISDIDRKRPHTLRTYQYCWCDCDRHAQEQYCGILIQPYIIEIVIKPWDPDDPRNAEDAVGTVVKLQPFHEDEEGKVYFRRQASLVQYSMAEMALLTRQEVKVHCESEIQKLKHEIEQLKKAKEENT